MTSPIFKWCRFFFILFIARLGLSLLILVSVTVLLLFDFLKRSSFKFFRKQLGFGTVKVFISFFLLWFACLFLSRLLWNFLCLKLNIDVSKFSFVISHFIRRIIRLITNIFTNLYPEIHICRFQVIWINVLCIFKSNFVSLLDIANSITRIRPVIA